MKNAFLKLNNWKTGSGHPQASSPFRLLKSLELPKPHKQPQNKCSLGSNTAKTVLPCQIKIAKCLLKWHIITARLYLSNQSVCNKLDLSKGVLRNYLLDGRMLLIAFVHFSEIHLTSSNHGRTTWAYAFKSECHDCNDVSVLLEFYCNSC